MNFRSKGALAAACLALAGCTGHQQTRTTFTAPDAPGFVSDSDQLRRNESDHVIVVRGCVRHPGTFRLDSNQPLTLAEALRLAGGGLVETTFDNGAALNEVRVSRLQNGTVTYNTLDARPGHPGEKFILQPGDDIFVPEEMF